MFSVFSFSKKHVLNTCDAMTISELGKLSRLDVAPSVFKNIMQSYDPYKLFYQFGIKPFFCQFF